MPTKPITPHLWFDYQALDAVDLYVSTFPDSRIVQTTTLRDTPSGDCEIVSFELCGQPFMAINGGPLFKFNPSISFLLNFDPSKFPDAAARLDSCWETLSDGGTALIPVGEVPFSQRYGWIEDRFGVSWQLMLTEPQNDPRPFIVPFLMFVGDVYGKAEEASNYYRNIFSQSHAGSLVYHPAESSSQSANTVMFSDFVVAGTWLAAMDSDYPHDFEFNEAISFLISCSDQNEIDYYWDRLSGVAEAEQCGWLKDKFGVSWQVTPAIMDEMLAKGSQVQIDRLTQAGLAMKKLDVATLTAAFESE